MPLVEHHQFGVLIAETEQKKGATSRDVGCPEPIGDRRIVALADGVFFQVGRGIVGDRRALLWPVGSGQTELVSEVSPQVCPRPYGIGTSANENGTSTTVSVSR
jgi:hypothetical protein